MASNYYNCKYTGTDETKPGPYNFLFTLNDIALISNIKKYGILAESKFFSRIGSNLSWK